jgi:predicted TIM-barrel fold metal-dependent hydrolase
VGEAFRARLDRPGRAGYVPERAPKTREEIVTDRYLVISSDCHAGLPADQYREYVDPKFRGQYDESIAAAESMRTARMGPSEDRDRWVAEWREEIADHGGMRGSWDASVRDKELDGDGVACEVIFPDADAAGVGGVSGTPFGAGLGSSGDSDPVLVMQGAKAHNRWLAELCAESPERRVGVALVPILHDHEAAIEEIAWAADHGLRGVMIPTRWMSQPSYNDPVYDPIWAACVDHDMVLHTHSGAGPTDISFGPGTMAIYASEAGWWAARPMHVLILGGVFERFPTLHYCVAENGAWWVPDLRERMDAKWIGDHNTRKFGTEVFRGGLSMKPGDYIDRNCWLGASTMHQTEVDRRHGIGIDNLMWGNDFPHPEGTWPHTREWLRMRFHDVPVDETRKILGLNAVDCYGFDAAALAPLVERIGPTVDDIHGGEVESNVETV